MTTLTTMHRKLTTRELPHLAKTVKITVRENNGVYSTLHICALTDYGARAPHYPSG